VNNRLALLKGSSSTCTIHLSANNRLQIFTNNRSVQNYNLFKIVPLESKITGFELDVENTFWKVWKTEQGFLHKRTTLACIEKLILWRKFQQKVT